MAVGFAIRLNGKSVAEFRGFIAGVNAGAQDLTPLWNRMIPAITDDLAANFGNQGSLDGAWQPLSPTYAARKARRYPGAPILVADGTMRRAAIVRGAPGNVTEIEPHRLFYGVDLTRAGKKYNYAQVHDRGGVKMPKREFMAVRMHDRRDKTRLTAIVADYFRQVVVNARRAGGMAGAGQTWLGLG
jgi:hypothetical protein